MDLVACVLVLEQPNELFQPLTGVVDQSPTGLAQVLMVLPVEDIRSKQCPEIRRRLLVGWHESLGQSPHHLIRVELLTKLTLQGRVVLVRVGIAVLRQQGLALIVVVTPPADTTAGEHVGDGMQDTL